MINFVLAKFDSCLSVAPASFAVEARHYIVKTLKVRGSVELEMEALQNTSRCTCLGISVFCFH